MMRGPHNASSSIRALPRRISLVAICYALLVLFGWTIDSPWLKGLSAHRVPMHPVTAVCFILVAAAVLLLEKSGRRERRVALACAAVPLVLANIQLFSYLAAEGYVPGAILFHGQLAVTRVAPNTALNFILLTVAIFASRGHSRRHLWIYQSCALLFMTITFLSVLGHLFGATAMFGVGGHIPMALNTALLFQLLSVAVLLMTPDRGVARILFGKGIGSQMAKRLLVASIAIPCLIGWLRLEMERAGWLDAELGVSMMVALDAISLCAVSCWAAHSLNRVDGQRRQGALDLTLAYEDLERRVQQRTSELAATNATLQSEMTARSRIQDQLRHSEERLRLLVDSINEYAILMLDSQGRVATWNAGAERIKGYSSTEIVGQHLSCFYTAEDVNADKPASDLRIAAEQGRFEDEGWRVRKDGTLYWASVIISAMRDPDGQLCGFSKISCDMTERKCAELQIKQLNTDLALQLNQLERVNDDLAHKNQENETFVYSVSHDLRSPLVNLQGFSKELALVAEEVREIISSSGLDDQPRERGIELIDENMSRAISFIQTSVIRLSNIIDALLRLSRAGRVEYQAQHVVVQPIITRVVESMGSTFYNQGATPIIGTLPPAWGDPTAIEQVFANLVDNALKYLDPNRPGKVEIGCLDPADDADPTLAATATYYVKDNGLGIPEEATQKIFLAFKRAHPDVAPGEGMGLAIVRRMVERHGGSIWVESTPGVGSTFYVKLPTELARPMFHPASRSEFEERNNNDARTISYSFS